MAMGTSEHIPQVDQGAATSEEISINGASEKIPSSQLPAKESRERKLARFCVFPTNGKADPLLASSQATPAGAW